MTNAFDDNRSRTRMARIGWGVALLLALAVPFLASERQLFVFMNVLVLAVFATSFNVLLGYTGLVSFAHASYYGVGSYTVALLALHFGMSPVLGFVLAPVFAGLFAYLTGLVALRATRLYFALLTLALGQVVFLVSFQWRSVTRGDDGIHGVVLPPALNPPTVRYYTVLALAAGALAAMALVLRSPFGATLRAIRENDQRAGFLGVKVKRYQLASFVIGGTFAGYAGGMFVLVERQAFPVLLHWTRSAEPIFVTLIGGLSSFAGPTVGAVVFGLLRDWITRNVDYWQAVLGIVLLLIILFLPGGIMEGVDRIRDLVRRPRRAGAGDEATDAASEAATDATEGVR